MPDERTPAPADPPASADPGTPPTVKPGAPGHDEWLIDEAVVETFPASDPISPAAPKAPSDRPKS